MDNREGTIVSIITYTNNRFTCYAKKVCINLTNSMYACLICRSFYQSSASEIEFLSSCKSIMIISDSDNTVSIANCTICKYDTE